MQLWVAFEWQAREGKWQPSKLFDRPYRLLAHIKASLRVQKFAWEVLLEQPDVLVCSLTDEFYNRLRRRWERRRLGVVAFLEVGLERRLDLLRAVVVPQVGVATG